MEVFYQRYGDVINLSENELSEINENGETIINEITSQRNLTLSALSFTDLSQNFDLIMK
jgi:hypothetical protein